MQNIVTLGRGRIDQLEQLEQQVEALSCQLATALPFFYCTIQESSSPTNIWQIDVIFASQPLLTAIFHSPRWLVQANATTCSLHIGHLIFKANNLYFIMVDEIDTVWKLARGPAVFEILLQRLDAALRPMARETSRIAELDEFIANCALIH